MGLTQITTGGVDNNINIDSNTLKVDGTNNRVGIGTAAPATALHVSGSGTQRIRITGTGSANAILTLDAPSGFANYIEYGASASTPLAFYDVANTAERMRIDSSGRVGINKTPSTYQFEVSGGTANTVASFESTDATARILFKDNSGEAFVGGTGDAVTFYTSSSATERMRINSSGRLLLNTTTVLETSNAAKLQITHTSGASIALGRNDAAVTDGNDMGKIAFYGNDGGGYEKVAQILCEADGPHASGDKPGRLMFQTTADNASSPTERMRIDSSGDVQARRARSNTAGDVALSVQPSDSTIHYGLRIDAANNSLNLDRASGTAANLLTIDSSGNLGIGTTTITNPYSQSNFTNVNIDGTWGGIINFKLGGVEQGWIGQRSSGNQEMILGASSGKNLLFATNGNNERMRIDSSGRLLVGTSTSTYNIGNQTKLGVVITGDLSRGGIDITGYTGGSSTGRSPELNLNRSIGTTDGSVTALSAAPWQLGKINFSGSTGSNFSLGAQIYGVSAGTAFSGSNSGGEIRFATTAVNATSPTERMRITSTGQLQSHSEGNTTMKPMQGCRAFCCFKGTGTVSVFSSFNVSALTDLAAGHYEVSFSTSMIDANYGVATGFQRNAENDEFVNVGYDNTTARLRCEFFDSGTRTDSQKITVAVFR